MVETMLSLSVSTRPPFCESGVPPGETELATTGSLITCTLITPYFKGTTMGFKYHVLCGTVELPKSFVNTNFFCLLYTFTWLLTN